MTPSGAPRVLLTMTWHDLLFAHWPIPAHDLRDLVPQQLEIDTFEGTAWLGVVPFRMTGVRPFGLPLPGGQFAFAEINVRTYVKFGEVRGVWFLSLHGAHRLAAVAARRVFHVPYSHARVQASAEGESVRFVSHRAGSPPATFRGTYWPTGPIRHAEPGTLEAFLTDRLSLFASAPDGRLLSADVEHGPWPLQEARATIEENTMAAHCGLSVPDAPPHLLFVRRINVRGRAPIERLEPGAVNQQAAAGPSSRSAPTAAFHAGVRYPGRWVSCSWPKPGRRRSRRPRT